MQPGHFFVAPDLRFYLDRRPRRDDPLGNLPRPTARYEARRACKRRFFPGMSSKIHPTHPPPSRPSPSSSTFTKSKFTSRAACSRTPGKGYDSGGGVIESREAVKWTRELVGTMRLEDFADLDSVRDELVRPDPASDRRHEPIAADFGGGAAAGVQLRPIALRRSRRHGGRADFVAGRLDGARSPNRKSQADRILRLRRQDGVACLVSPACDWMRDQLGRAAIWQAIFNGVSLSPFTDFVENATWLRASFCAAPGADRILQQPCRATGPASDRVRSGHVPSPRGELPGRAFAGCAVRAPAASWPRSAAAIVGCGGPCGKPVCCGAIIRAILFPMRRPRRGRTRG